MKLLLNKKNNLFSEYRRILLHLILFIFIFSNSYCISTVAPGILFNYTKEHIYPPESGPQLGEGRIIRKAETCNYGSYLLLSLLYYGTPGNISEAMSKSEIKKIAVVDYSTLNILGPIFFRKCTIIWGE